MDMLRIVLRKSCRRYSDPKMESSSTSTKQMKAAWIVFFFFTPTPPPFPPSLQSCEHRSHLPAIRAPAHRSALLLLCSEHAHVPTLLTFIVCVFGSRIVSLTFALSRYNMSEKVRCCVVARYHAVVGPFSRTIPLFLTNASCVMTVLCLCRWCS